MKKYNSIIIIVALVAGLLCACSSKGSNNEEANGEHSDNFVRQIDGYNDTEDNTKGNSDNSDIAPNGGYSIEEDVAFTQAAVPSPDDNEDVGLQKMKDELNKDADVIKALTEEAIAGANGDKEKLKALDKYKSGATIEIGENSGDMVQNYIYTNGPNYLLAQGKAEIKLKSDYSVEYVHYWADYVNDESIYGTSNG